MRKNTRHNCFHEHYHLIEIDRRVGKKSLKFQYILPFYHRLIREKETRYEDKGRKIFMLQFCHATHYTA